MGIDIAQQQASSPSRLFRYKRVGILFAKTPFEKTKNVIDYLGRYTHRIAISNHRVVKLEDGKVSFRWRDYHDNNKSKIMTVDADEFIWRFLLHVLPDRFVKIRHYGILGNRCRREKLNKCRELLACVPKQPEGKTQSVLLGKKMVGLKKPSESIPVKDYPITIVPNEINLSTAMENDTDF